MRDKSVLNKDELLNIISNSKTCYVAMIGLDGKPYNLPLIWI